MYKLVNKFEDKFSKYRSDFNEISNNKEINTKFFYKSLKIIQDIFSKYPKVKITGTNKETENKFIFNDGDITFEFEKMNVKDTPIKITNYKVKDLFRYKLIAYTYIQKDSWDNKQKANNILCQYLNTNKYREATKFEKEIIVCDKYLKNKIINKLYIQDNITVIELEDCVIQISKGFYKVKKVEKNLFISEIDDILNEEKTDDMEIELLVKKNIKYDLTYLPTHIKKIELNKNTRITIKNMDFDSKVVFMKMCMENESLDNYDILLNISFLIGKKIENEYSSINKLLEEKYYYCADILEKTDMPLECKEEIRKVRKKLLEYYLSIIRSKNLYNLEQANHIENLYFNLLRILNKKDMSDILNSFFANEQETIIIDNPKIAYNANLFKEF